MKENLGFCEYYNYPSKVKSHFEKILDPISSDEISSVLLIGGTSRGELSYQRINRKLLIYSDYEFLLIANGKVRKEDKIKLRHYYDKLQKEIANKSPLFHIDFDYISQHKLANLKRTFWTYEVKKTGIAIWGKDLKDKIPEVTLQNINLKELNEALIWRLWTIFLYTPPKILTQRKVTSEKEVIFKYVLSKNTLDITTWLLPWEGYLVPSFSKRITFINENYQKLSCANFFGDNFKDFLNLCLNGKLKLQFENLTTEQFYNQSIVYFINALQYLIYRTLSLKVNYEEIPDIIIEKSNKFFRDYDFRRKVYDSILMLKYLPKLKNNLFSWYFIKKHGLILVILLKLHIATLQFVEGKEYKANINIDKAMQLLKNISFLPLYNSNSQFLNKYIVIRKNLVQYMCNYFLWIGNQKELIYSIEQNFYNNLRG